MVNGPLGELKTIRRGLGGSINDVVLAACITGLRLLLLERGEQPPPRGLRAMVPMNLRQSTERLALGNRVSSLFVELPVTEPIAHLRHRQIVAAIERQKSSGAASGAEAALDLATLAPPAPRPSVSSMIRGTASSRPLLTIEPAWRSDRRPVAANTSRRSASHPVRPAAPVPQVHERRAEPLVRIHVR